MAFEVDSTIEVPPAEAFDKMADARNEPRWNSQVSESTLTSAEPIGQGSRFRTVNRRQPYDAVITTFDRPSRLVFEVTGKQMDITASFDFSASGAGTALHSSFDFRPKGALKLIFPLMKSAVRRDGPRQAANFKRFCETGEPV